MLLLTSLSGVSAIKKEINLTKKWTVLQHSIEKDFAILLKKKVKILKLKSKVLQMKTEAVPVLVEVMKNGGIILYPTDTIWGIGCDATNEEAVAKIYKIKQRVESKSMLILVENDRRLQNIVEVTSLAWDLIDLSEKPTTIIYDNPQNVAKNIIADDNTLGIRLIEPMFLKQLIGKLNKPLVSTSANISGTKSPKSFSDISKEIVNGVDYVLDIDIKNNSLKSSSIIKLGLDSKVEIIRR